MPVSDWSTSASSNTTVAGVNIAPGMARADVDNAIRGMMAELKTYFNSDVVPRVALASLPAVSVTAGKIAYLSDSGREGYFICRTGTTPSDPQQGIYIASNTFNFYWERIWDGVNGHPEWFGARTGDGAFDNRTALNACIALCPVTLLRSADYWITGKWTVNTPYRTIIGATFGDGYNSGTGTRILSNNSTQDVFQLGPDTSPGTMSTYLRNVVIENLTFAHGVAITAPAVGSPGNAVKTVRAQYVLNPRFIRVSSWEPFIGFYLYACVRPYLTDCKVLRTLPQIGAGDFCRAFWAVGSPAVAASGNPSLFIQDCSFECNSALTISNVGIYCDGEFADTFIDRFETSAATNGIVFNGSGSQNYGRIDVHIRDSVLDQCKGQALDIQGLNSTAMITIDGGYYQSNATATAVVWIRGGAGSVSLGGGAQIVCGGGGNTIGLYVNGQPNVDVDETVVITDCSNPVAIDGSSSGGSFSGKINNPLIGDATKYAITLTGQTQWFLRPRITGKANAFAQGIYLIGTANDKIHIDPTRVNPSCISGGLKVLVNATGITTPGYYTSSGGAGTSGLGINVSGITN